MADQDDVRRIALSLPEAVEGTDQFGFSVLNKGKQKAFVWVWKERVEPKRPRVPRPDVIAVRVANQGEKDSLLASDRDTFFTEPHYNGFPAVLVRLPAVDIDELRELITDAWRCQAPRALVGELDRNPGTGPAAEPTRAATGGAISVVPANEASLADLLAVFGTGGEPFKCQCQWFKFDNAQWRSVPVAERAEQLRAQTGCGDPGAGTTSGLVAYLDGEPVGWCAVEPRTAYQRLLRARVPWTGRSEDKADDRVWAVTCFVTRAGFRRRGVSYALARAAVDFARQRGASAVEGYPMITEPGQEVLWGQLYVGNRSIFAAAGFTEVSRPTLRRAVMRVDF